MQTKRGAIADFKREMGGREGVYYQFPRGHWSWASLNSPVFKQLRKTGEIYPGVPAIQWDFIPIGVSIDSI